MTTSFSSTCVWQMDEKIAVTLSIYTVDASNKDQAMLMDTRMKDMINNITIIMSFTVLEPLNCSPHMCETDCQLIHGDGQLIGCDGHLITCVGQLIAVYSNSSVSVFQLITSLMAGLRGKPSPVAVGGCLWTAPPLSQTNRTNKREVYYKSCSQAVINRA